MDHNDENSQLRATLNDVLGLEESDSLLHDEDSFCGYADGPDRYLDSDDEDLQILIDKEMNKSHQSDQDEYLSVSNGKEYDQQQEDDVEEEECAMHDDSYTDNQYTADPIVAMGKTSPTAILTDQCESIKEAIPEALPNTVHSITIAKFEDKWHAFVEEYDVGGLIWFQNIYSERFKWVPVFLKHYFWVGMMSTQRYESMHASFDGYISGRSFLKQFVEQYEVVLRFRYEKEMESQASERKQLIRQIAAFD
ncbi:hypothetical protein CQW23_24227 [Capsicum baccatum]|uniref:Protein FAR1-RELATED SEQUENCE n=1 Tax=Capsicum baccatum TaxID=33114 RepID=A0A2G2VU72_CAPBA|nr:hypothetical protein CQW23_24227 [Capsicum baccatum]